MLTLLGGWGHGVGAKVGLGGLGGLGGRQLTHLEFGRYHFCLTKRQESIRGSACGALAESYMEKKKLEQFKKRLESRQQELRRNVSRTEQDGRSEEEESAQDIADRAARPNNKEFSFHHNNMMRHRSQ